MKASGPTIAPIVTGSAGSSTWRGSYGGRNASTCACVGDVDALVGVGEDEAVHADHHRQRELLGEAERLDVQVERLLVGLGEELDPAAVALATSSREWSFQMLIGAPIARLATVITIGRPRPDGVVDRLGHEEQALARGRGVGARAGGRGADRHRHRARTRDSTLMNSHGASSPALRPARRGPRRCASAARSDRRR